MYVSNGNHKEASSTTTIPLTATTSIYLICLVLFATVLSGASQSSCKIANNKFIRLSEPVSYIKLNLTNL